MTIFNLEALKALIANGENSVVAFKSAAVRKESLAREMVAFSNSQGGVVLIGVEDEAVSAVYGTVPIVRNG